MKLKVLLPLIFAGMFFIADVAMFIRMIHLVKKSKEDTAEDLGSKFNSLLYATGIVGVLTAICMIIVVIVK